MRSSARRQGQSARERTLRAGQGLAGRLDVGIFGSGVLDVIPRMPAVLVPLVPRRLHGAVEYSYVALVAASPWLVGFSGDAAAR